MNMKTIKLFVALYAMFLFCLEANAQEAMTKMKKTFPAAMQEYGKKISELKTDYIIAIDVSATMGKHKEEVVPALTRFFDSIGDGNYVRIISFGTIAKEELTRLEISKQNRPQIVEKLNYVYDKVMNDPGMRGYTDFVLLGNKAVDLVESDQDSDIHFLVIFSDIMDDPKTKAKGSKHRAEKEWNDLAQRFKSLEVPVNTLSTYFSHEAKDEKQILESIDLVQKAFPNFEKSNDINEVLGGMLEDSKFVIYTNKLKQLITQDINALGEKELFTSLIARDKGLMLEYDFDKDKVRAPRYIRGIVIDTCVLEEKTIDVLDVEFDSNKEIAKRGGSRKIGAVKFDKGGIYTKDCSADYQMEYHFLYQIGKDEKSQSFTKDMEALGLLGNDQLLQKAKLHADGELVLMWPFWLVCAIVAAIIIYIILLIVNTIIPHTAIRKKLVVKDPLTNNMQYYQLTGKRTFTFGNQNCNCIIPGASFVIKATCRNGSPLNLLWKRRVVLVLDPQNNTGVQMAQGSRNNLMKASIRKGKEVTVTQNIVTRFVITLS